MEVSVRLVFHKSLQMSHSTETGSITRKCFYFLFFSFLYEFCICHCRVSLHLPVTRPFNAHRSWHRLFVQGLQMMTCGYSMDFMPSPDYRTTSHIWDTIVFSRGQPTGGFVCCLLVLFLCTMKTLLHMLDQNMGRFESSSIMIHEEMDFKPCCEGSCWLAKGLLGASSSSC